MVYAKVALRVELQGRRHWRVACRDILSSEGIHVAVVLGPDIFDLMGNKLYRLKGGNIYRLSGEFVGHLNDAGGSEKRLDRSTDRLFPGRANSEDAPPAKVKRNQ